MYVIDYRFSYDIIKIKEYNISNFESYFIYDYKLEIYDYYNSFYDEMIENPNELLYLEKVLKQIRLYKLFKMSLK